MTRPVHPAYVVSADWSKHARKRSVYIADLQQRRIRRAEGHAWHLASLLTLATDLARHGSVLVGIDLALGVPRDYWRRVRDGRRRRQPVTFLDWLCELDPTSGFFQTTDDPHRWRVDRPWFAVPPGHGGLRSFTAQAGDGFRRRLDHATQAKPLFAVSGMPGTVGSGTRDFWKALIPVLARKRDFAIWPFEGELPDLFATPQIVLAETYPALAYAVALATDLPTHRLRVAKTHHAARDRVCGHLAQMPWVVANGVDLGDLGPTRTNEDDFDAHLTAAAILRCVLEGTPVTRSEWIDAEAEGSMLLAGPVDLHKGAVNLLSRVRGSAHATLVPARATVGAGTRGASVGFRPHPRARTPFSSVVYPCPIPAGTKVFRGSRGGWDAHVASSRMHPQWHPDVADRGQRKRLFRQQYADWFLMAATS